MEMQDIPKEGKRSEEDERASALKLEVKTEEEAEPDPYSKLENPSEDIYSEAVHGDTLVKTRSDSRGSKNLSSKQTEGNTRLFRAACLFLTIICLVLLLVVIILSVKLQTGSTVCPERAESTAPDSGGAPSAPKCSHEKCLEMFPTPQPQHRSCLRCANGWLLFGRSCFYLSAFRLSWEQSQRNCTVSGGALAVVNSRKVQNFLTEKGKMKYWIGLRQKESAWTWVDNTVLRESYWDDAASGVGCGILSTGNPPDKNWITASCEAVTYYICQMQL